MPAVHPTRRLIETSTAILIAITLVAAVFVIMPQGSQAAFHGNLGSFVSSVGSNDYVTFLEEAPAGMSFCFGYMEDSNNPDEPEHFAWMFHVSNTANCSDSSPSSQRTWLITAFGGSTSGAQRWLTSGDSDYLNNDFDGLEEANGADWLCYLETDGIDGYSIGDIVYIDQEEFRTPTSGGTLTKDDLRLSAVSSSTLTPFSVSVGIVASNSADLTRGQASGATIPTADPSRLPTSTDLVCGDFEVKMLNLGSLDSTSRHNVYYLAHDDLQTNETVYPGMLRLTSTSGISGHGQKVLTANSDNKRTLQILGSGDLNLVVVGAVGDPGAFDTRLAIQQAVHPAGDTADELIQMHDIYVKRNTGHGASNPGTLVTHAPSGNQIGVGTGWDESEELAGQIYFIDTSPSGFDPSDPVYIKHPENGDCTDGVEVGDIRLNVPGFSAGTSVRNSDSDFLAHSGSTGVCGFEIKLFSERDDTRMPLKSVSNGKFIGDSSIWNPDTDPVFITSASSLTVNGTHRQVWDPIAGGPVNEAVDCWDNLPLNNSDPDDDWCGETLRSGGKLKTTGQTTSWLNNGENQGDRLYWSDDNFLTVGDYRMGANATSNNHVSLDPRVEDEDADIAPGALFQSSGVTLFASQHTGFLHPTAGDIQIFPSFGNRWTHSTSGAVPMLEEVTAYGIARAHLGEGGTPLDDVYYLDFSGTPCDFDAGRVLRLLPYDNHNAGSFVLSGHTIERQASKDCTSTDPANYFGFIDNSPTGFDTSDFVYLSLPEDLGGLSNDNLRSWDARITPVSHGGSTFSSGTQTRTGDSDLQSFGGNQLQGTGQAKILWWDTNLNGVVDQSDALWLRIRDDGAPGNVPTYLDIRLNGPPTTTSTSPSPSPTTPDNRPTSSFTTSMDGRELTVDGSGSSAIAGRNLEEYAWDFGDGNEVIGSQAILTHTYEEDGQYTVRLTVTDSQGESRTRTETVQTDGFVPPPPPATTPPPTDDDDDVTTPPPTDDDDDDDEEEATPGIAVVMILAALGVVLVALRRRE